MKKIILSSLITSFLFVSCGSVETGVKSIEKPSQDSNLDGLIVPEAKSENPSIRQQLCSSPVDIRPEYRSGRVRASGWIKCVGPGNVKAIATIKIKSGGVVVGQKSVNFSTWKGIGEKDLKVSVNCSGRSGGYTVSLDAQYIKGGSIPINDADFKEYEVACSNTVNQFKHPTRLTAGRIATHGWNNHKSEGHFPKFQTDLQLAQYVEFMIKNRYDYSDFAVKAKLRDGRIAIWDGRYGYKLVTLYEPGSYDRGTVFKPKRGKWYFDNKIK